MSARRALGLLRTASGRLLVQDRCVLVQDPFGDDDNDMPMVQFHHEFCDSLQYALHHSWMDMDYWIVKEGAWKSAPVAAARP